MPAFEACAQAMTTARNWVSKVRSRADLLPPRDVGTPELVQSEVAFAGCQAARYQPLSSNSASTANGSLPDTSIVRVQPKPVRLTVMGYNPGEPLAAAGEDRRSSDQARPVLLAAIGREPSDAAAIWKHGATARRLAGADRIEETMGGFGFPGRRKL